MFKIKFRYKDDYSNGEWCYQECICNSIKECKEWYGLGLDCIYEILSIDKVE